MQEKTMGAQVAKGWKVPIVRIFFSAVRGLLLLKDLPAG